MTDRDSIQIIKRNGDIVTYDSERIRMAIAKAMISTQMEPDYNIIDDIEENVFSVICNQLEDSDMWSVEDISNEVENQLMEHSLYDVAKEYIIYRYKHSEDRNIEDKRLFVESYKTAINASTGSKFDANANVSVKNIATLSGELNKRENILLNRKLLTNKITQLYGRDLAKEYIRQLENHEIYKHDETSLKPYCVSINMYPFLVNGLKPLGGSSKPPTHLQSYNGSFINLVFAVAAQFAGAVATPEYLMYMDYFIRKDYGDDYYLNKDMVVDSSSRKRTIEKVIEDSFQQVVHSINQPAAARDYQSVFWNIGYFDKHYFESMFSGFYFPDMTKPKWESLDWLQRKFMNWFNEERLHAELTFPVETVAMLTENGDIKDKDYKDFISEMYSKGHSFFTYLSDSADSLSSCCFEENQKILLKSSNGVHHLTFKDFYNSSYDLCKKNYTVYHNGSWVTGKIIKTTSENLYKIETVNNKTIIVTSDHLNPTIRGDIKTENLTENDCLLFSNRALNTFPERDLKLTYEQGVLIGAYLGDGSIYQRTENHTPEVHFSINKTKYDTLFPIFQKVIKDMDIDSKIYLNTPYNNVYPVRISSLELRDFIKQWTGGNYAQEKTLNLDCLMQSLEFRQGILDGYYITDGGNSNRIYTTSKEISEQLEVLITSLGKISIVNMNDRTDESVVIRGESFKRNFPVYCIRWYDSKNKRTATDVYKTINNSTYFKIKNIERLNKENREVYCFEMKNSDEPYFTLPNGIITHNCRLRNEIQDNEFSFSLGAGGVATGSKSVMTLNLNRLVQNAIHEGINIPDAIRYQVQKIHKYQIAYNEIMKENLNAGLLPVYDAGFISLEKQYLTIGINGMVESAEFLGIEVKANNEKYYEYVDSILSVIWDENKKARTEEVMFNTEFVPAENLGVKHADWDKQDGYFVPRDVYNSYFYIVEDEDTNVLDKFRLHGARTIHKLDGGTALHCNLEEHLSKEQYSQLLKVAAQEGCNYFTFNIPETVCNECSHISKHKLTKCTKCGSKNLDYMVRVIGYRRRVSSFSLKRQEEEKRRYYGNLR